MGAYYGLVVLLLLFALLMHGERKGNVKYILLAVVLMFCVYGLRDAYSVGNDSTTSYLHQFERMENMEWEDLPTLSDWARSPDDSDDTEHEGHDRNIGLPWLMKIVYDWTDGDYQSLIVVISAFVMIAFAHFVRRYSPSPIQSILYYFGLIFFTFNISALKQSIAMAFILFAFDAVYDRRLFRFLLMVFFASLFHFPALVFFPAYWIGNMKLGRTYLFFLAALFVVTYYFRDNLVDWMTDNYDTYITDNGLRFLANKVIVMLVIIVAALVIRPPSSEDKLYCSLLMLIGVAAVIQTFSNYNNTFERLSDYYFQFAIVFIPMVFEEVKTERQHLSPRELQLVRRAGPYLFCAFAIWRFLNNTSNDQALNPFQFYFQAEKAEETLSVWLNLL